MKRLFGKLAVFGLLVTSLLFSVTSVALAHVTVKPAEVVTAGFQTFAVSVPNEKALPTVAVKVLIPADVKHVTPTVKSGWEITTEKEGTGEEATIKSITWSGGAIPEGRRDDFTFSAQVPAAPTDLQWKAYQTYSDGLVVSWDHVGEAGHDEEGGNSGPASITKVVSETAQATETKNADQAAAEAKTAANRSLYVGIAGILLGLVAIFLATRKR